MLAAEFDRLIADCPGHPSIAAPLATGITVTSAYLVQEFVPGESLDVGMREKGPMAPAEALKVAGQVGAALDHAAAAGITHGALHPRDVIVLGSDARLTGLGVAKALERAGAVAPVRRPYAPPERAAGVGWDHHCDVFSLAALVHEMLWARRITASGEQAARALTEVPGGDLAALRRVFARALAAEPADRFESAGAFLDALGDAIAGAVASQAPPEPLPFVRKEQRDRARHERSVRESPDRSAEVEPLLPLDPPLGRADEHELVPSVPDASEDHPPAPPPPGRRRQAPIAPPAVSLALADTRDAAHSGLLPLMLTGVVFLAVGFAAGYGVASWWPAAGAPGAGLPGSETTGVGFASVTGNPGSTGDIDMPAEQPSVGSGFEVPQLARTAEAPVAIAEPAAAPPRPAAAIAAPPAQRAAPAASRAASPPAPRVVPRPVVAAARPAPVRQPDPAPPAAGPGSVQVESRPAGAAVFIDGRLVGRTPLRVGDVGAGEHVVTLELEGYGRWMSAVQVAAGERQRVAASLEPAAAGR